MVCFDAAVGSVWLWAACLLMGGTVPVLLVLWPEALRLRTSRLLEAGAGLGAKMGTSGGAHANQYSLAPLPPVSLPSQ